MKGKGFGVHVITSIIRGTYKPIPEIAYTVQGNGDFRMCNDHPKGAEYGLESDCFLMIFRYFIEHLMYYEFAF